MDPPLQPPPLLNHPQVNNSQQFDPNSFSQFILNPQYPFNLFGHVNTQQSQFQHPQPSQPTVSQTPRSTQKNKKGGEAPTKERNPNWSQGEDEALCKAWLFTSEDPVTGADQAKENMWDRTRDEFNQLLGHESARHPSALHNRWSYIQAHINKFSGFMRTIERAPTSGFNVEDSIGAAKQLYYDSQGHVFKWYGCWLILKDTAKWFHHTQQCEERKHKIAQKKRGQSVLEDDEIVDLTEPSTPVTQNTSTPTTPGSTTGDDIPPFSAGTSELPRPGGRKAGKNTRQKKTTDHSEVLNLFVAEFSNLRNAEKEFIENENCVALRREQMRIEAKRESDREKIRAIREEEKRKFEKEMMMTDPTSMPTEDGKAWVIAQQKAVMARINAGAIEEESSGSRI